MDVNKITILKMFGPVRNFNHVPIEEILDKYPTALDLLKEMLEEGLIQTFNGEKYDPEKDLMEQLTPGPKITDAGFSLLFRSSFVF